MRNYISKTAIHKERYKLWFGSCSCLALQIARLYDVPLLVAFVNIQISRVVYNGCMQNVLLLVTSSTHWYLPWYSLINVSFQIVSQKKREGKSILVLRKKNTTTTTTTNNNNNNKWTPTVHWDHSTLSKQHRQFRPWTLFLFIALALLTSRMAPPWTPHAFGTLFARLRDVCPYIKTVNVAVPVGKSICNTRCKITK